ncbi:ferritin-like domain-containing protein [Planomonospora sp. ID82291]|uniref:ferritin-like domain-containing protein n=1 Tax=Planomonospora sp. ID82291 TaxID=2738136 RepID=UPI0027DB426D|nr:ferritin-like domain-containing protein [Planomonospora sp. ID82291]
MSTGTGGLSTALAAEHAAVYAYGVIAARTTGDLRATATAAFRSHRVRRDRLRVLITERGGVPAEADAAYALPVTPSTAAQAVELAVLVERGVTTAYLELAADDDAALRRMAALAMQECVKRAYGLRPEIEAFPGMPPGAVPPAPSASPSASASPPPTSPSAAPDPDEDGAPPS